MTVEIVLVSKVGAIRKWDAETSSQKSIGVPVAA